MSPDPLPSSCLLTGNSGACVQPRWAWGAVAGRASFSLCPSPGLAGSSLPGGCRAPGCLMNGLIQPGSSFPRRSLGDPTPVYGCERWHWPVPTVPVTVPSATEEHRGFHPEPHWGGDGLLSLLAVRGTVRELGQTVLHPGAVWDGDGGGWPAGMGPTAQDCVRWGQGLERGWHLVALSLARSRLVPSITSGSCAASCETRWK